MKKIRQKSQYEKKGKEITTYAQQMDNNDYGAKRKAHDHTIVMKNSKTGQVFGYKTIAEVTKFSDFLGMAESIQSKWDIEFEDGTHETVNAIDRQHAVMYLKDPEKPIKRIKRLELGAEGINEAAEDTRLPQSIIGEITSLIKKGAKDLAQAWKNVYELVHTAYHVAHVKRPMPDQKGAWGQYEDLLKVGVRALSDARGMTGKWRMTQPVYTESGYDTTDLDAVLTEASTKRKHRIFARVKNLGFDHDEREYEIEADDMNAIIHEYMNKAKRQGRHVRIEPKANNEIQLTMYAKGVNQTRDEQIVRLRNLSI